jgi:MFS-type transporter involved in bile tolerance (Atg22 family)
MCQFYKISNVSLVGSLEDNWTSFLGDILFKVIVRHTHALDMGLLLEFTVFEVGLVTQVELLQAV